MEQNINIGDYWYVCSDIYIKLPYLGRIKQECRPGLKDLKRLLNSGVTYK